MNPSLLKIRSRVIALPRRLWHRRKPLAYALASFLLLTLSILLWPMDRDLYLRVSPSGEMQDRSGRLLYAFMNDRQQWCFERELSEISPLLIEATLAVEDHRFFRHPGVDPLATLRAAVQNLTGGRVVSGASTLTMQVIKQREGPAGSLAGKLRQAVQAVRLEARASKAEILKAYLNGAPYGLNLVGCEAAARRYFGKPSIELTLEEAALLAGLPKSPTRLAPLAHRKPAIRRRNLVLARMLDRGFITRDQHKAALAAPLRAEWNAFPALSPHLAMRLRPAIVHRGRAVTTLDRDIQQTAERLLKTHLAHFEGEVDNAAMIVIDVPSASMAAHVGSGAFDEAKAGQYDATRAARSPGSALKPFTYALAMEQGCLYPCETLLDDTADYGVYSPENMDQVYHGLVSAESALRRSLNVPAVTVLERLGTQRMYDFLRALNLGTLRRPAEYYGLGLTLGSCEVRLEQLAAAYCALANLGQWRPLDPLRAGRAAGQSLPPRRILSRGVCLKLYEMLEQSLPNETWHESGENMTAVPRVAWKTGTSWGYHDAWAFVFNRQWLVGVWMGNSDARPSRRLVGARASLPLAGRMMRALPVGSAPCWPDPGEDLHEVTVCALSGLPASRWCLQTRPAWLPREQFLHRLCDMHYPKSDDENEQSPLTTHNSQLTTAHSQLTTPIITERWPGSAKGWDLARITAALPVRERQHTGSRFDALTILAPVNRAEFILTGAPGGDRIKLATSLDARTAVHWYLNDVFIGTGQPDRPLLLDLAPGRHRLVCMTPQGLTDQVQFEVIDPAQENLSSPRDAVWRR